MVHHTLINKNASTLLQLRYLIVEKVFIFTQYTNENTSARTRTHTSTHTLAAIKCRRVCAYVCWENIAFLFSTMCFLCFLYVFVLRIFRIICGSLLILRVSTANICSLRTHAHAHTRTHTNTHTLSVRAEKKAILHHIPTQTQACSHAHATHKHTHTHTARMLLRRRQSLVTNEFHLMNIF